MVQFRLPQIPYKNKKDQKVAAQLHYQKNKELIKKRAAIFKKIARKRNKEYLNAYLSNHPCVDCGECDIRVLDFDHVRGSKIAAVTHMANRAMSIENIQKEIDKCDIRCANCHRIKHWKKINEIR